MTRNATLVDFYAGRASDSRGRMIDDVWRMSLDDLEHTHDYIQWLFPLAERSPVNPSAPVVDEAVIAAFQSPDLQARLVRSAEVMAKFYGFVMTETDGGEWRVTVAPDAPERQAVWLMRGNHNFLRLTRIMKSLAVLGQAALARAWLDALRVVYQRHADVVGNVTMAYWEDGAASAP